MKIVNKKAYYNYQVLEDFTAGLMLVGSEVKSLRENNFNFGDSFIYFKDGELYVKNMSISKYKEATFQNHEEMRDRKILLTKKEISKISKLSETKGIAIIPLEVFTIKGRFKVKVGVCRGKKDWNKKDSIKKRDIEREVRRDNGFNI
jgi:SsrA-binding protein